MMKLNYYINKKFTIEYLQTYMDSTFFKYLELLEINIEKEVSKLYNQNDIDDMSQEEYDILNKLDNFFENTPIDFKVSSMINLTELQLNEETFNKRLNFIMYDIQEYVPKEMADWFYINIYISDINPNKKDELVQHYQQTNEIKNHYKVVNAVIDHFIELEALRTVIYLLQNNQLLSIKNVKKLLENILNVNANRDNNFSIFLDTLISLISNKQLYNKAISCYKDLRKIKQFDIEGILWGIDLEEKRSLSEETYQYLKVSTDIYKNAQYKDAKEKILENLGNLTLDCILLDYSKKDTEQFINLKNGLETALELIALSITIRDNYSGKKQRTKENILKKFDNINEADLTTLNTLYYFIEHNAHHIQLLVIPLSQYLALTYEESLRVIQELGFYHEASPKYKGTNFSKHFKFLQEAYNSNFRYLRD